MKRRVLSVLLCAALLVGLLPAAAFAADTGDTFQYQFVAENGDTATKISHPAVAPNANGTDVRTNDGVVDYVGNGVLSDEIGSDSTSGARGESYSWSALGHGDWVYTCLLYNAMGNTIDQMKGSLGYEFDRDQMNAALNVLYNGDFYLGEEDEGNPGGALVKINVKTGEVKILMSEAAGEYRHSTLFRNAVEYNGKFYFCGSVDKAPQIWQVDPETDECKMVYGMSVQDFYASYKQGISSGIRGLCVYNDELVISCVMKNEQNGKIEPQICSTKDPEKGFTVIATQDDLFDYPAYHFEDSIYGGSIWEIVEFQNKLYVSICTGTPENMPDENTMQSFAIVRGEKGEDGKWTWTPVVGDKADGAKYTFGIDPERTCSGAGVLMVYDDHLYIAEYNDEEIALINVLFNLDLEFMNKNLKQSVNLYRMDADENMELVVGDPTEMFPEGGTSDLGSGFGHNENQYIWRMTVHNGKLYCGTFDTSSLLEPIGQFANGDLTTWTEDQWHQLFEYIRVLLELTKGDDDASEAALSAAEQNREDIRELVEIFDAVSAANTPNAGEADQDLLAQVFSQLPAACFDDTDAAEADAEVTGSLANVLGGEAVTYALDGDDDGSSSDINSWEDLAQAMKKMINIAKKVVVTAGYMAKADRGCDVYVTSDGVNFETLTTNGFGDPFNHGLRVFAETDEGLACGTANPFYGTQWWYMEDPTYTVTVNTNGNGTASADYTTAAAGTEVTLTATPDSRYRFMGWKVVSGDVTIEDNKFTMPAGNVEIQATFALKYPFTDVVEGSYYEDAVIWGVDNGIIEGTSATTFEPDNVCTRAQIVTFLWRAAGRPAPKTTEMPFTDVKFGSYYYNAVLWAVENGVTKGTSETTFSPCDTCNRAQAVTMLWRYQGSPEVTGKNPFTDVTENEYYSDAVLWAAQEGVAKGMTETTFEPFTGCTRAQIVTFIWRALSE